MTIRQGGASMNAAVHERPVHVRSEELRTGLRELAAHLDVPKGFRTEIVRGTITISPTPSVKLGAIVRRIYDQVAPQLSGDSVALQVVSIASPFNGDDYMAPDLAVVPASVEEEEGWLLSADAVDLVMEVVSPNNALNDTVIESEEYASWGIPLYLLIDPRKGTVRLHWDPAKNAYRAHQDIEFGEILELSGPLKGIEIDTSDLPRYGA
ncbi:Uma2 family endonuclease [Marinactinospora rubrisoli]|uniref:Uma2 family endonuclease n=1 Tax=Marinactinospora rubrisoli TaxID=2715399 RepID=A0ABW2KFN9_9ACTN